jgi:deoxycytidylate deaminase
VFPLMTCNQCAAQLIQAGINRVVVPNFVEPMRWQESFDAARQMFVEAGIPVARIPLFGSVEPALDGHLDELLPIDA